MHAVWRTASQGREPPEAHLPSLLLISRAGAWRVGGGGELEGPAERERVDLRLLPATHS